MEPGDVGQACTCCMGLAQVVSPHPSLTLKLPVLSVMLLIYNLSFEVEAGESVILDYMRSCPQNPVSPLFPCIAHLFLTTLDLVPWDQNRT